MMRVFFKLMIGLTFCFVSQSSAAEDDFFNPKNYVYDYEGNALFIKVYLHNHQDDLCHQYHTPSLGSDEQIYHLLIQEDQQGSFIAVPIKKKKKSSEEDEDKDESNWECPYCGTINPSYRNCCSNPNCVLYRKGNKNWYTALENHELSAHIIN